MRMTFPLVFSAGMVGAMALGALAGWLLVPAGAQVAVHFGLDGQPNRFADPAGAFAIMPLAAAFATAVFALAPRLERSRANLRKSRQAYAVFWVGIIAMLALAQAVIVLNALGVRLDVARGLAAALGAFLVATGNVLPKTRPNAVFGVRTPWTLASERVWTRTHRLYGWASVMLGLVLIALAVLDVPAAVVGLTLGGGIVGLALGACAYSWWIWRRLECGEES